jgi:tRNA-dihydrouridine synthase A
VVEGMCSYVDQHIAEGGRLIQVARHMLNLFNGQPGARKWRRFLSKRCAGGDGDSNTLMEALKLV